MVADLPAFLSEPEVPVWVWALLDVQSWAVWPLRVTGHPLCPGARPHQSLPHVACQDTDSARLVRISRALWPSGASLLIFNASCFLFSRPR